MAQSSVATVILVEETAVQAISAVASGSDSRSNFWISAYFVQGDSSERSKHATIEVVKGGATGSIELRSFEEPDLSVKKLPDTSLQVQWPSVGVTSPRQIIFPSKQLTTSTISTDSDDGHTPSEITSLDVSPQGGLYAVGTVRGEVLVGSTNSGELLRRAVAPGQEHRAHLLDILQTRFFPASSGEALLSSSRDMHIKLWSTVDGSQPRTFQIKGQSLESPPRCVEMVGETGRNFLVGAGRKVFLFECGSGQLVHEFEIEAGNNGEDVVTTVLSVPYATKSVQEERELEFGTWGTAVLAVHGSRVTLWDTYTKEHINTTERLLPEGAEITGAVFLNDNIITATSSGELVSWSVASLFQSPLATKSRTRVVPWAITAISVVSPTTIAILTNNSPVLVSLDFECLCYFTGFDSAAATTLTSHSSHLYVGGKAGRLFSYSC